MSINMNKVIATVLSLIIIVFPINAYAADAAHGIQNFTSHWAAILALVIFGASYSLVIFEEQLHLRKSKPVLVSAGIVWLIVALVYISHGDNHTAEVLVRHNILEFAELFLFLLAAMTFINTMYERGIFDWLRSWLLKKGFSLRGIFWATGIVSFFLSPIADNLTTALLMATVAMAVGGTNVKFISIACVNIVVAANAGGAFSPFGDITTLMVWQKGIIEFQEFFVLFLPSVANWIVPAVILSFFISQDKPQGIYSEVEVRHGAWFVVGLFILTIIMAVSAHNFLHLPPVLGMMTGLGLLKVFGYYLYRRDKNRFENEGLDEIEDEALDIESDANSTDEPNRRKPELYNIFKSIERAEWDTLMFFYGVILSVGGLGALGYMALGSELMYDGLGATNANILVGVLSAIFDNIPVMFAVLAMEPSMSHGQWLLVTLTAGVGGSMLSVGSAAGVAVMGQARGIYTFFSHLKWTWAIALGYIASIWVHFLINKSLF
ncbi:MAG: sodium:proton antiporter NhaD [Gammaproteobacteria bacterium]